MMPDAPKIFGRNLRKFLDKIKQLVAGTFVQKHNLELYNQCYLLCVNASYEQKEHLMQGLLAAMQPVIDRIRSMQQRQKEVMRYLRSVTIIQRPGGRNVQGLILDAVDIVQGVEMLDLHCEIDILVTR